MPFRSKASKTWQPLPPCTPAALGVGEVVRTQRSAPSQKNKNTTDESPKQTTDLYLHFVTEVFQQNVLSVLFLGLSYPRLLEHHSLKSQSFQIEIIIKKTRQQEPRAEGTQQCCGSGHWDPGEQTHTAFLRPQPSLGQRGVLSALGWWGLKREWVFLTEHTG